MGSPTVIRYADDFVVLCHSRQEALEVKARLASWLTPRGLAFNEDKTRVVSLNEGFDFLGFNVRRYRGRPLIKPSKAAVRRIRERLRTELRSLRGTNAETVIRRLNPIVRGWAAYYRTQVSSETFDVLDHYLWGLIYKWARFSHRNKPASWIVARYLGKFNGQQDRWVFGDRNSGAFMHKFSWTNIVRHTIVKPGASPDDPVLAELLGLATAQTSPPDQPHRPAALPSPGRPLRDLQGDARARRGPATSPTPMGNLAGDHPQDDRRHVGPRQPGQGRTPSRPPPLPPRQRADTANRPTASKACSSRMLGNGHVRFLGGPGAARRRAYPTNGARRSTCLAMLCRPCNRAGRGPAGDSFCREGLVRSRRS